MTENLLSGYLARLLRKLRYPVGHRHMGEMGWKHV